MPLQATSGAASYDAFGGGVPFEPNYIEEVFSTYLYTGNGSTQTITNGIDLAGEGGLVWTKQRNTVNGGGVSLDHYLIDTARGGNQAVFSNRTDGQATSQIITFGASGYTLDGSSSGSINFQGSPAATFASWTFRKQPKFFDIVTYTGNGANRTIAHNLGSVPGCIMVKRTDTTADWQVYHRSLANTEYMVLNSTAAKATGATRWNSTTPTSTVFSLGTDTTVNASGGTYVAYLFAHDAGGFGLTGTDNVISCGSFTVSSGTGSTDVNLGYEPQWLLAKPSTDPGFATNWRLYDTMRGWVNTTNAGNVNLRLNPNLDQQETSDKSFQPTATGFTMLNSAVYPGVPITYIYIAIRRGPMKVPTTGTSVFAPVAYNGAGTSQPPVTSLGFPPDMMLTAVRSGPAVGNLFPINDRLRGVPQALFTQFTDAEATQTAGVTTFTMNGCTYSSAAFNNQYSNSSSIYVAEFFRRAPGFFDEVCYTGTGTSTTQAHNLGAVPELMIVKARNEATTNWSVFSQLTPTTYRYNTLQTDSAGTGGKTYGPGGSPNFEELSAQPTSTVINLASSAESNASGRTFVAYLFATCAGVSKVGSYTGTGTTQTINCGFTGGARFILIKRTDSNGDWYVWDSARGIVAGNDPYLLLNSTAAEVTNTDYVDTAATGFEISSTAPAAINASGGSFIFLAIA
jgi:hypothetical protein